MDFAFDFASIQGYAESLFPSALAGDLLSILLIAGIALPVLAILFKLSEFLLGLVKRFFLFIVIGLSAFFFATTYYSRVLAEGFTTELLLLGVVGLLGAAAALVIALVSLAGHAKGNETTRIPSSAPNFTPTQLQHPNAFTSQALTKENLMNSLKDDRSLLAVLSYVIISQFGVFSSKTIAAPNPEVGMFFFGIFFIGAFLFIKTTYHSYLKGISHLIIASVIGFVISVALGIFWAEIPAETMLSMAYFGTEAMVAFITGIAVSLLMGTKN